MWLESDGSVHPTVTGGISSKRQGKLPQKGNMAFITFVVTEVIIDISSHKNEDADESVVHS